MTRDNSSTNAHTCVSMRLFVAHQVDLSHSKDPKHGPVLQRRLADREHTLICFSKQQVKKGLNTFLLLQATNQHSNKRSLACGPDYPISLQPSDTRGHYKASSTWDTDLSGGKGS